MPEERIEEGGFTEGKEGTRTKKEILAENDRLREQLCFVTEKATRLEEELKELNDQYRTLVKFLRFQIRLADRAKELLQKT